MLSSNYYYRDTSRNRFTGKAFTAPGDGNCMFHSFKNGLEHLGIGDGDLRVSELRHNIIEWVDANLDMIISGLTVQQWIFNETSELSSAYISRMRCSSEWGGSIELIALSHISGVPVCVWHAIGSEVGIFTRMHIFRVSQSDDLTRPIHDCINVIFEGGQHYNGITELKQLESFDDMYKLYTRTRISKLTKTYYPKHHHKHINRRNTRELR
jgi:hypothetical protein